MLLLGIAFTIAAVFMLRELMHAPEGLQDETGFHIVREAKPEPIASEVHGIRRAA